MREIIMQEIAYSAQLSTTNQGITPTEIHKYIDIFYDQSTWNNNYPCGYIKVAELANMSKTLTQKIRGMLERMNIIGTEKYGNITRSKPLVSKLEAISIVQKIYKTLEN
jgi:predicted transcriptional regulator